MKTYNFKEIILLVLSLSTSVLFGQQTYTFTNATAIGQNGPTQVQVDASYSATSLNGVVTINTQGIQEWVVPQTTIYSIEVFGAKGGSSPGNNQTRIGGNGASMYGEFALNAGDNVSIIVGQSGEDCTPAASYLGAGGGGGSFVTVNGVINIAAAGGGGAGIGENGDYGADGTSGLATPDGNISDVGALGTSAYAGSPGINGAGGTGGTYYAGSGGAGWNSNGTNATGSGSGSTGGLTYANNAIGGTFGSYNGVNGGVGGFGGGGGATFGGGGGGGYSGGAAGAHGANYHAGSGGGGGSYNIGVNPNNVSDANNGEGYVVITVLCNASANSFTADVCDAYTVPSGDTTYMVSGVYNDTIPNATGCDSIMTITVNVSSLDLNTTTTDFTITADHASGTYQWINCSDNSPIAGETSQSFTADANGDYAVILSDGPCSDTSACATIAGVGIDEVNTSNVSIYPNPTNGEFYVSSIIENSVVSIYTMDGKVVISNLKVTEVNQLINLRSVEKGIYFVEVSSDNSKETIRLVIE